MQTLAKTTTIKTMINARYFMDKIKNSLFLSLGKTGQTLSARPRKTERFCKEKEKLGEKEREPLTLKSHIISSTSKKFCIEVIDAISQGKIKDKDSLNSLKLRLGREFGMKELPSNPDILAQAKKQSRRLVQLLSIKPLRTLSGVAPVALMTRP